MGYLGEFEQLILFSVLRLGEDAYGGSVREHIEDRTGKAPSSGAMYTALGRLERKGLVESRPGSPVLGRAGRPRKFYTLTASGARALRDSYSKIQAVAGGLLPRLTELADG